MEVNEHDIEDPDHAPDRLKDIQDEFQSKLLADYPLVARNKSAVSFRRTLTNFFHTFVEAISTSNLLLGQQDLIENVQVWVGSMSAAPSRPFRHTACLIALEIISALSELGRNLADSRARYLRQVEGERKNKKVNQARVKDMQSRADEAAESIGQVDEFIRDWFDTVYVHRYRDVDPRIRVDCATYLGQWIMIYPEQFLDGMHLRYLGWLLSDTNGPTRLEDLKQLQHIFKNDSNLGGLRQFTERFRPRMVEIATRDAELTCRIHAIELLDVMRGKGLLEPDDIDTLGKLMFDLEPRVRKALVPFFVASVDDAFQSKVEELGEEALEEIAPGDDDFESPRLEWLHFKSLAELMQLYESDDDGSAKLLVTQNSALNDFAATETDSRSSLAAHALLEKLSIIRNWEMLAGYLLVDHSCPGNDGANGDDLLQQLQSACRLSDVEEFILLDVLNASVKSSLSSLTDFENSAGKKKTKQQIQELQEEQESAAQRLAATIPRLLNKFGAAPEAASAVLRLERVLNLDIFQELRQDSTTYSSLLEDINKQFLTHENDSVINEASAALLHAKSFEELEEITSGKLQALWDDTATNLARLSKVEDLSTRGNLHISMVQALSSTVLRIENLASISSATEALEKGIVLKASNARREKAQGPRKPIVPLRCLLDILNRGKPADGLDHSLGAAEDALVGHASKALFFYFMWQVRSFQAQVISRLDAGTVGAVTESRNEYEGCLDKIIASRAGATALRVSSAGTILDLHTIVSTLRRQSSTSDSCDDYDSDPLAEFTTTAIFSTKAQASLLKVFTAAEKDFAQKAGKTLGKEGKDVEMSDQHEEDDNREPESDDEEDGGRDENAEPESLSDEADGDIDANGEEEDEEELEQRKRRREDTKKEKKAREAMLAEQALCGLAGRFVMAHFADVLEDGQMVKRRLARNKTRLGPNFKEVVAALERGPVPAKTAKGKAGQALKDKVNGMAGAAKGAQQAKSAERVQEEEEGDGDEDEVEQDGEEDLKRRELVDNQSNGEEKPNGDGLRADEDSREESVIGD